MKRGQPKAIIMAGGTGSRLRPMTQVVSKHLLPIYDRPMIYYPLSTLMLAGLRQYLLICNPEHLDAYQRLLGDGSQWGIAIKYAVQKKPKGIAQAFQIGREFIGNDPVALMLGDNIIDCENLERLAQMLQGAMQKSGAVVFACSVGELWNYGVVELDSRNQPVSLAEKPKWLKRVGRPHGTYAVIGLYYYDNQVVELVDKLRPSARGELEITDLNRLYLQREQLHVVVLDRLPQFVWWDAGRPESLFDAGEHVRYIRWLREGQMQIGRPEEAACHAGLISEKQLLQLRLDATSTRE